MRKIRPETEYSMHRPRMVVKQIIIPADTYFITTGNTHTTQDTQKICHHGRKIFDHHLEIIPDVSEISFDRWEIIPDYTEMAADRKEMSDDHRQIIQHHSLIP